jgi:hypothetical protein
MRGEVGAYVGVVGHSAHTWLLCTGHASPVEASHRVRGRQQSGRRGTCYWAGYGPNLDMGPK